MISQVGDLAASAIKRNHQVKDYGHLIPGHGGILDRFDSMIFTAPAIYLVITLLGIV
jgi:phosphatidate cytidylyltransferase